MSYPRNLEEALGQPLKFPPATLKAVRAFAASKPWRGNFEERKANFANFTQSFAESTA